MTIREPFIGIRNFIYFFHKCQKNIKRVKVLEHEMRDHTKVFLYLYKIIKKNIHNFFYMHLKFEFLTTFVKITKIINYMYFVVINS